MSKVKKLGLRRWTEAKKPPYSNYNMILEGSTQVFAELRELDRLVTTSYSSTLSKKKAFGFSVMNRMLRARDTM